jgi:hypothetical protein
MELVLGGSRQSFRPDGLCRLRTRFSRRERLHSRERQAVVTYRGLAPGDVGLGGFDVTVPTIAASDTAPIVVSRNGTNLPRNLLVSIGNRGPLRGQTLRRRRAASH